MPAPHELPGKVTAWLETQGYPLEMVVARAFRAAGFRVIQSDYYVDPEAGEAREVDVIATREIQAREGTVALTYIIECKSSRDRPWVLFTSTDVRPSQVFGFYQRFGSELGKKLLKKLRRKPSITALPALALGDHLAYAVIQAMKGNPDDAYSAVIKVVKSAIARERLADTYQVTSGDPLLEIIQPLVVIDGFLFECSLAEDNTPRLSELGIGTLEWRHPVSGLPGAIVNLATLWSLQSFIQQATALGDVLSTDCSEEVASLLASWHRTRQGTPSPEP